MLAVILGPVGSGKSTLIRKLERSSGYGHVMTYSTRPLRNDDTDRMYLPKEQFWRLSKTAPFPWITRSGKYEYGICQADLNEAISYEDKVYLLDFSLENINLLQSLDGRYARLVLLPPSTPRLMWRLARARRWGRMRLGVRQYHYAQRWLAGPDSAWVNAGVYINSNSEQLTTEVDRRLKNWREREWNR